MATKFSKYLDQEEQTRVPLKKKRALESCSQPARRAASSKKQQKSHELRSVKMTSSAYEKMDIVKMVTSKSYVAILDEAMTNYLERMALENDKIKAMKAMLEDYQKSEIDGQTSIDDFL